MKTTIEISDDLLLRAKQAALARSTTLRAIVEEALQRALGPARTGIPPLRTVTWGAGGRAGKLDSKTVRVALARERDETPDDADHWLKRFGFVPPGIARK